MKHLALMRTKNISLKIFLALPVVILMSCSNTKYISLIPFPNLSGGSPLIKMPSQTFTFNRLEDKREDKEKLGYQGGYNITTNDDIIQITIDALSNEFRRNGHIISNEDNSLNPDFILSGSLNDFSFNIISTWTTITISASIILNLKISSCRNPDIIYNKIYNGNYEKTGFFIVNRKDVDDFLHEALKNLIKEITTDHMFLNFIEIN